MSGFIYFLANRKRGTLYLGVTSNLSARIAQHKSGEIPSFSQRYSVTRLVYLEETERIEDAIAREKQLKNWKRDWKIELIEKANPEWEDLSKHF